MGNVPEGYCQCGCGEKTTVSKVNNRKKKRVKGVPLRFIHGHNARGTRESHPSWTGGKHIDKEGYVQVFMPEHSSRPANKRIREHRLVVEQLLGRPLKPSEIVHHNDEDRANNSPSNLILFESNGDHRHFHGTGELRGLIHAFI